MNSGQLVDQASWYDLWAAGVAINEMCVRTGQLGTASDIGESQPLLEPRKPQLIAVFPGVSVSGGLRLWLNS